MNYRIAFTPMTGERFRCIIDHFVRICFPSSSSNYSNFIKELSPFMLHFPKKVIEKTPREEGIL
jgi:hypothetical protein